MIILGGGLFCKKALPQTPLNIPLIKTCKIKAIRLAAMAAICRFLECQPGISSEYRTDKEGVRGAVGSGVFVLKKIA